MVWQEPQKDTERLSDTKKKFHPVETKKRKGKKNLQFHQL